MKRFAMLLLPLLLVAVALGANERRNQKYAEDRAIAKEGQSATTEGTAAGWLRIPPEPSGHDFRGITLSPAGAIWVTGFNTVNLLDYIWRSADGGLTWSKKQMLNGEGITEVAVANETTAVFGSFTGKIYRTTNSGSTWDSVFAYSTVDTAYFDGVRTIGKDTMIALGDADSKGLCVARSVNAGKDWTRLTNLPTEVKEASGYASYSSYRQAMDVFGKTVWMSLYFGSSRNPRLLKSTDAGDSWTTWEVTLTGGTAQNYYFRSINFLNDSIGFAADRQIAASNDHWMHKTTNGGLTWSDTISVEPGVPHANAKVRSIKPIRGTTNVLAVGWAGTNTSKIWASSDQGATWTPTSPGTTGILTNSAYPSPTQFYIMGNGIGLKSTPKNVRAVTFNLNTATVPDTLPVTGSKIQVRGGANGSGFSPITWGNDVQNELTSVGGDYWRKTVYMQAGDTLNYKYVVAYASGTGWEQGVVPADFPTTTNGNRSIIVPDKDTTLNVEFWNNGANNRPQYFRPWPATPDSFINVYFRVSMAGLIASGTPNYNNDKDTVAVRGGGGYVGSDLDWGRSSYMTRESAASNGDGYTVAPTGFWSTRLRFRKDSVTVGQTISFKYMIGYDWRGLDELQGQSNRSFTIPVGKKDTTLKYVYYNNEKPGSRPNPDTVKVTFTANLAQAAGSGGIDVLNDTLWVRSGYFSTSATPGSGKRMTRLGGTTFTVSDTVITAKSKPLNYQYYVVRNGAEERELYYNFFYTGPIQSEAERRQVVVDPLASKITAMTILDTATSVTQARRQPQFTNKRKLAKNVNVKWEVDLRPAYFQVKLGNDSLSDIQGTFTVMQGQQDSIMKWGVWINGLAVGGWGNPGTTDWGLGLQNNLAKKMYDNGTNGDRVAGDSIFTRQVKASPDSVNIGSKAIVGQVFKFGIRGGDNEGGKGGFGNNHNANIVDTDTIYTINDQFGSINPAFYDAWDYDLRKPKTPTSVIDGNMPLVYELAQNYPNPFNPTTKIEYSIPVQAQVVLKIYNVVGQEVATLVNEVQKAGIHNVKFSASNLSSGVYFYRLSAGDFTSVKKMVLLK